jgi:hypothetical protein
MTRDTPSEVAGYSVVLPPGWVQIRLDDSADEAVDRLVDGAFADVPADLPPDTVASLRRRLEGHLRVTLATARGNGGTELYLPTQRVGGVLMPASFVVAEVDMGAPASMGAPGAGDPSSPDLVTRTVARLVAADESARAAEVDGAPAVRSTSRSVGAPSQQMGISATSRRVDYLVAVPGRPGRWLAVSFTVLEATDDPLLAELLVELFDAAMTTVRWATS